MTTVNTAMAQDDSELRAAVQRCIADSLAVDTARVTAEARLVDDLGADSLDFIDILFGLERELGHKLRNADVDAFLRAEFSEKTLVDGRYLPRAEIDRLLPWLPALQQVSALDSVTPREVFGLITVETFVRIVVSARRAAGPISHP